MLAPLARVGIPTFEKSWIHHCDRSHGRVPHALDLGYPFTAHQAWVPPGHKTWGPVQTCSLEALNPTTPTGADI